MAQGMGSIVHVKCLHAARGPTHDFIIMIINIQKQGAVHTIPKAAGIGQAPIVLAGRANTAAAAVVLRTPF
jgi:hypothetical protein